MNSAYANAIRADHLRLEPSVDARFREEAASDQPVRKHAATTPVNAAELEERRLAATARAATSVPFI